MAYKKIVICLDNSDHSNAAIDLAVAIAKEEKASLAGCHVYAAKLHTTRFEQMENGLPPQYQKEEELRRQRDVHDSLITKGLQVISDSYLAVMHAKAEAAGIKADGISREGKNYEELVREIKEGGCDLVAIGALGLGTAPTSTIGSVCERVVRRVNADVLVTRQASPEGAEAKKIIVAIDGSPMSFGALLNAVELAKIFSCKVEAISVFDPDYHYRAFRSIAGVLSEEAGKIFKFKEQEKLHEEIIDKGLAKIYQDHLSTAAATAKEKGVNIESRLLSGKPFDEIIKYARVEAPFMLAMGKTGVHSTATLDIGSNTENCLRGLNCHVLISTREFTPAPAQSKDDAKTLRWTAEATNILEKIPSFARGIAKNMVEEAAKKQGLTEVTAELMIKVRNNMGGS